MVDSAMDVSAKLGSMERALLDEPPSALMELVKEAYGVAYHAWNLSNDLDIIRSGLSGDAPHPATRPAEDLIGLDGLRSAFASAHSSMNLICDDITTLRKLVRVNNDSVQRYD